MFYNKVGCRAVSIVILVEPMDPKVFSNCVMGVAGKRDCFALEYDGRVGSGRTRLGRETSCALLGRKRSFSSYEQCMREMTSTQSGGHELVVGVPKELISIQSGRHELVVGVPKELISTQSSGHELVVAGTRDLISTQSGGHEVVVAGTRDLISKQSGGHELVATDVLAAMYWLNVIRDEVARGYILPMFGSNRSPQENMFIILQDFDGARGSGPEEVEAAMRWLQQCLECAKQQQWTPADSLRAVGTRMKGYAELWFKRIEFEPVKCQEDAENNWLLCLTQFALAFVVRDYEEMAMQVAARKQLKHESAMEYADALRRLIERINFATVPNPKSVTSNPEMLLKIFFARGLRDPWAKELAGLDCPTPLSFEEHLQRVVRHEKLEIKSQLRNHFYIRKHCKGECLLEYAIAIHSMGVRSSPPLSGEDLIGLVLDGCHSRSLAEFCRLELVRSGVPLTFEELYKLIVRVRATSAMAGF